MKIFLLLAMVMPYAVMAQQASPLIGDWRGDWTMTLNHADQLHKDKYQSSNSDIKKRIEDGIATRKFAFKADTSFSLNWKSADMDRKSSGAWSWNAATNILTLAINGSSREYKVLFLNENTFVLRTIGSSSDLVFDETIFIRI